MPNVVGMSESQAIKTLREKGLVERVTYEDRGLQEGICFMQDVSPREAWNTDASLFIFVQRKEETINIPKVVDNLPPKTIRPEPTEPNNSSDINSEPIDPIEPIVTDLEELEVAEPIDANLEQLESTDE